MSDVIERDAPEAEDDAVDEVGRTPGQTSEPPPPQGPGWRERLAALPWETIASAFVVTASSLFVFLSLHPDLIVTENTPTGGDMGSHVWGPMYLMREVLPGWRLSGWSPDWYAGFPAYQFYMVVPMLLVVALNVGVRSPLLVLALAGGFAWFEHQQRRDVEAALERERAQRWALDKVAAELSVQVQDLTQRVDELKSENRELRHRSSETAK